MDRQSDFTLGDFWGIENVLPDIDDDRGTSLVFINTEKGRRVFDSIRGQLRVERVDGRQAVRYNSAMIRSSALPEKRDVFLGAVQDMNFSEAVDQICIPIKIPPVKHFISRVKRRIGFER